MVSLGFSVTYFLPTVRWSWGRLSPLWKWVPGTFLGVKAAGAWRWRPHHLHVPNVMKSGGLNLVEPSGPHRACYGTTDIRCDEDTRPIMSSVSTFIFVYCTVQCNFWLLIIAEHTFLWFFCEVANLTKYCVWMIKNCILQLTQYSLCVLFARAWLYLEPKHVVLNYPIH
jgi:hypothetical protein